VPQSAVKLGRNLGLMFSIMTLSIMALSIMAFSIMTFSIIG